MYSLVIKYLECENVKTVLVDYRIDEIERYNLEKLGYNVLVVSPSKALYESVSGHPDMLMHVIDKKNVIVHRDMDLNFINELNRLGINVYTSSRALEGSYPYNIALNAVNLDNLFIHNLKYTDNELLQFVRNKKSKNVKQGYTKCSTAIVSKNAIITSDRCIAKCSKEESIDVLLLPPGDILLPGLDYGFIGGCCGLLAEGVLAFYGNLKYYSYEKEILSFLSKHNVEPVFLRDGKLIDRGSIFTV
jgi:hypothetical protein